MSAIVDRAERIPANLSAAETLAFLRQRNARALEHDTTVANPEAQDASAAGDGHPPADSTPAVPGQLLTEAEVCQRLGIGQRTLQRLIGRGEIQAVKMSPKLVRINPAEVERYLATRTQGGNPAPGASAALPAAAPPEGTVRLDPEAWYNERVLRILGVAEKTLRDAVKAGELRCRDLGRGKRLFKGSWLLAWLEGPAGD